MSHHYSDLITIFEQTFFSEFNTKLICGKDEPLYLPKDNDVDFHRIVFARGYYASALHEIAHWCVAGPERRKKEDFGYWYKPDGRTEIEQKLFEQVEVRPQAYEWIFSISAGFSFNVSCDNLNGDFEPDRRLFIESVYQEVATILQLGLPPRVLKLSEALRHFYNTPKLDIIQFKVN